MAFVKAVQPIRALACTRPKAAGVHRRGSLHEDFAMARLDNDDRDQLDDRNFAFPKERKEPLEDASHVRNAVARFDQVEGVSDAERDAAWKRIQAAARKFDVDLAEKDWRELGKPH
jgi:hypothetical protein